MHYLITDGAGFNETHLSGLIEEATDNKAISKPIEEQPDDVSRTYA